MTTTNSEIAEAVRDLGKKVDDFITTMPATYVRQIENDRRYGTLEGMYNGLKAELTAFQDRYRQDLQFNNTAHDSINLAVVESERRILGKLDSMNTNTFNKIDSMSTNTWSNRLTMILGAFGWILTLGIVIIDLLTHH